MGEEHESFHPDRLVGSLLVIDAMARGGRYRSQFETGTSNGGLTAHPSGDRWSWESRLFGGAYDDVPAAQRPKYGALDFRRRGTGGSPCFGSAHLRLRAHTLERTTFCYPDSVLEPTLFGVADRMPLVEQAENDEQDRLDDYIEAGPRPRHHRPATSRRSSSIPASAAPPSSVLPRNCRARSSGTAVSGSLSPNCAAVRPTVGRSTSIWAACWPATGIWTPRSSAMRRAPHGTTSRPSSVCGTTLPGSAISRPAPGRPSAPCGVGRWPRRRPTSRPCAARPRSRRAARAAHPPHGSRGAAARRRRVLRTLLADDDRAQERQIQRNVTRGTAVLVLRPSRSSRQRVAEIAMCATSGRSDGAPRCAGDDQRPVVPSICSRRMSACPACRAVSLVMCASTHLRLSWSSPDSTATASGSPTAATASSLSRQAAA